jgi:cyclase
MQKISSNVYVETGFRGCNCSFVVTAEGVVMIDTPMVGAEAIKWRDEIARHGQLRYLINSEPHMDHIAGNYFFGGTVVGHEGTRSAILDAKVDELQNMLKNLSPDSTAIAEGFHFRPSTITFSQRLSLYLGKHTFQLINMPGHSPYQAAVYVPEERVVFTSDNVTGGMPFFRQAIPDQWLESLKRLQQLDVDVLVPGHGPVGDKSYIPKMSATIQAWIDVVTTAINKGMSLEETQSAAAAKTTVLAMDMPLTKERLRMNVAALYQILKKK